MKTTKNAYALLNTKISAIERAANFGIQNGKAEECKSCLHIKNLTHELRQIMRANFFVDKEIENENN